MNYFRSLVFPPWLSFARCFDELISPTNAFFHTDCILLYRYIYVHSLYNERRLEKEPFASIVYQCSIHRTFGTNLPAGTKIYSIPTLCFQTQHIIVDKIIISQPREQFSNFKQKKSISHSHDRESLFQED